MKFQADIEHHTSTGRPAIHRNLAHPEEVIPCSPRSLPVVGGVRVIFGVRAILGLKQLIELERLRYLMPVR
jgi:hypothetical protein